jgi:ATP-dependent Clp protease ATP-binding subunit ClpA
MIVNHRIGRPLAGLCEDDTEESRTAMLSSQGFQHQSTEWVPLRPMARSSWLEHVAQRWAANVVGQPQATDAILRLLQRIEAQARQPRRVMGSVILLGPPGCGKTHSVEALADVLLGSPSALLKVNCAEYQQQHETARLVGAPPGYIGHADTEPVFTRENIERHRTPEFPYTLILFDEIEKAHHSLYSLLLGVLDRAELNDGRNRHVDFSSCLFFFTSNIGSKESLRATESSGFVQQLAEEDSKARHFRNVSLRALKRHFPPEFLRRIEETIVFQPLRPSGLKKILDLELAKVSRGFEQHPTNPFQVEFTSGAKSLLLTHGCDTEYGAAHLQHTLARELQDPLYRVLATGQVHSGDRVGVFAKGSELVFRRA